MERMTGLDAGFLYMETPTLHMHTLKVAVIDPTTVPGGYTFAKVKEVLGERLHLLPAFRRRVVEVPFGLHHPMWIEDPAFDLDYHVRRVGAPSPGGPRELCELISDIASRQLDRSRPLWEIWVVEGLQDGRIGFVTKIHHAVADGVAAAEMLANVMELEPEPKPPRPAERPWHPDPVPSRLGLVLDAIVAAVRALLNVPALVRSTVQGMKAVRAHRKQAEVQPPLPFSGPNTSFNGALTPHRTFVMFDLPLDDVKRVKNTFGVTLNDVVLGIAGGALREWLLARGEPVEKPLVAGVPVSTRTNTGTEAALSGNSVSNMFTSLCTDIADPVERLQAIHLVTKEAKAIHSLLGPDMLAGWSELSPPRLFAWWMRTYSRMRLADRHRPPINLVVSNVPGPRTPLFVAGSRLDGIYSVGPILEGIGLNVTVWSYLDSMNVGLVACREAMPDLWELADGIRDSLDELVKLAGAER
jgi:diacylglycerol O-acyltransferase